MSDTEIKQLARRIMDDDRPSHTLRGEYWIDHGDLLFAGDEGDINHEGHVIQYARNWISDEFDLNLSGEWIDLVELVDALKEAIRDEFPDVAERFDLDIQVPEAVDAILAESSEPVLGKALWRAARDIGDSREVAMKYLGWIWVHGNSVAMWNYTADSKKSLVDGVEEILEQDGVEEDVDVELRVSVGSTGYVYSVTLDELKQQQSVPQRAEPEIGPNAQLRAADQQAMPDYYQGQFGD